MRAKLNLQEMNLADLHPAEYNPRVELKPGDPEYERIKRSIETFTYVDPIIVNRDGTIIGGHQRYNVLLDLGYETADVVVVDKTKDEEKALNIALNKISGEWDEEKLYELLIELDLSDIDVQLSGFTLNELDDLRVKFDIEEAQDDGFDEEEALSQVKEPITRRGNIWRLGRHRLMCGDSTSPDDMAALMDGAQADLIVTDPPYNVDYGRKTEFMAESRRGTVQEAIKNDNMDESSFYFFLLDAFKNAFEMIREGGAVYVFHSDTHGLTFRQSFQDAGFKLSQCLIWEKNSLVLGCSDYQWIHEPILYGWKEGAAHYFINDRTQSTVILEDDIDFGSMKKNELVAYLEELRRTWRDRTSVILERKPTRNDIHPTMKPISLIGKFITNSSKPDWNVLDQFGGSGSTLMAAEQLGRTAYIMEMDEAYCDVIIKRWEEYTGQTAVLEE